MYENFKITIRPNKYADAILISVREGQSEGNVVELNAEEMLEFATILTEQSKLFPATEENKRTSEEGKVVGQITRQGIEPL